MIDTSPEWDVAAQMPGESWFAARLYYGDQSSYLSVAGKDFVLNDEKFVGLISNKPSIRGGFDIQTRETQINSGSIELVDFIDQLTTFGKLASTLGSGDDVGFENRRVDLVLLKDGITKFENGYPLLGNGRMYMPEYDSGIVVIPVEDNSKNIMGQIGDHVVQADAKSGFNLPAESAGKIKPIIYGDHRDYSTSGSYNTLTKEQWNPEKQPRFVPMVDLGGGDWMIENDKIAGTPALADGDTPWYLDTSSGKWVQLRVYDVEKNDATGVVINVGVGSFLWSLYDLPISVTNEGLFDFTDPENAIDRDVATSAFVVISGAGATAILRLLFPSINIPAAASFTEAFLMLTGVGDWGAANQLFVDGDLNNYYTPADISTTFVAHVNDIDLADAELIDLTFRAPSAANKQAIIYDLYRRVDYVSLDPVANLHWGGLGHALEAWADQADRSTHFDYLNSGDPVINPITAIESLSRNDMGLDDANINMPTYDSASNQLAAYETNFDIRVATDYRLFLASMSRQFRCVNGLDTNSQLTVKVILDKYTSADAVVNYDDIRSISFGRTDDDLLTSKVAVLYSYDGSKYLNQTDEAENTTTRTRYSLSEKATELDVQADKIDSEATAELVRDFELAFWQQHHNTIDEMSLGHPFMKFSPGDIVRLDEIPERFWPNGENITEIFTRAGQDILPYFMITEFDKSDSVSFKGIQMHDTTP